MKFLPGHSFKSFLSRKPPEPAPSPGAASEIHPTAARPSSQDSEKNEPDYSACSIDDVVRIEEVTNAEFYAGDLFRRHFRSDPPDYPRHFVALYRAARNSYVCAGYVHHTVLEDMYLCGGLVIDERAYRRAAPPHRRLIKEAGGIAEKLLRDTFARLRHAPAIWAYVGDKRSEAVCTRAGFRRIEHPYLMVLWNRPMSNEEKAVRIDSAIAAGPF